MGRKTEPAPPRIPDVRIYHRILNIVIVPFGTATEPHCPFRDRNFLVIKVFLPVFASIDAIY
jgi:hypothetical protein